jgi:drug/metabolite transporter (DMT)-like permease
MATAFVDAVRKSFRRAGFHRRRDDGQELGGPFLVGVAGRLFIILEDFQAAMPAHPFAAVGAGSGMAMGALHALAGYADLTPAERARRALTAAEACCWAVRRPFHLVGSPIASGPPPPAPAATATAPAHSVRDKKIS